MPQWPAREPQHAVLSDAELDRLDVLLEHHAVPNGGMSLEMTDGFLSALAVGPERVDAAEYLPAIFGEQPPEFEGAPEREEAVALITRMWNTVTRRAATPPDEMQTVLMPVLALPADAVPDEDTSFPLGQEWAEGFIEGVALRQDAWDAWSRVEWIGEDLAWIAVLAGYEIDPPQPLTWAEREAMVAEIPDMLHALNAERLATATPQEPVRATPQPGRNEPCPCGSGEKYKRCCGAGHTLH